VQRWTDAQNAATRRALDRVPGRAALEKRLWQLYEIGSVGVPVSRPVKAGLRRYFYTRRDGKQNQAVLYARDGAGGTDRALVDVNAERTDGTRALDWWFPSDDGALIATWRPGPHHEAFPGVLNGGIIGTILDCHCNWAAAHALMRRRGADRPPCTVTADYAIRMRHPTPTAGDLQLRAWVVEIEDDRATIDGELSAGGEVTATCRGRFVAVKPGHPAYHRW